MAKHTTTGKSMPSAVTPNTTGAKIVKTGKQMTYKPPKR